MRQQFKIPHKEECMEILKQGERVGEYLVEEIKTFFFESLYQRELKEQSQYISKQLQRKFGYQWFVFMFDERMAKDTNLQYYNNNDLVFHFRCLDWNVLIYGIS